MSQPGQGWYQQQPPYPQQPYGYGYGPPPGYGYPHKPSTAMAYVAAGLFVPVIAFTYIVVAISWDGTPESEGDLHALVSVLGVAFSDDITGNVDFAITLSMIFASVTTLFAVLLACRLRAVRWVLVYLAANAVLYYLYAITDLLSNEAGDYVLLPIVALLLWVVPLVVATLPATGRAIRSARPAGPPVAHGHWQ
ncbi:hypothetical protein ABZ863_25710 [Saccharomonospora sp. NPDC046836]|uniref:hypothetical protein n=1 Tax=Saccharomonospora sp. NPDC046836 TaxID=3156921 RepID=UPI0033CAA6BC